MSKKQKLTHDQKIIKALEKIKTPIVDELRNLSIYFKAEARSNETGIEHIAKNYHSLNPSDVELLEECIKNPSEHIKDRNRTRTYYYYHIRKHDKSHYIQIAHAYYKELKQEDIPGLVELVIGICLQHEFIDERTIRLTIELAKKIPNGSFLMELVENNIRRPRKSKNS